MTPGIMKVRIIYLDISTVSDSEPPMKVDFYTIVKAIEPLVAYGNRL